MANTHSISTDQAPRAIGPYSQAVACRDLLFVSGQIPLDPATGEMVGDSAEQQIHQVIDNLQAILAAAGCGLESVVKTTIYMLDLAEFESVNRAYAGRFGNVRPARATLQVSALPKQARVEMDAIAVLGEA
jgi:2-iminobutanoate/2-iminopropanoate deaminase